MNALYVPPLSSVRRSSQDTPLQTAYFEQDGVRMSVGIRTRCGRSRCPSSCPEKPRYPAAGKTYEVCGCPDRLPQTCPLIPASPVFRRLLRLFASVAAQVPSNPGVLPAFGSKFAVHDLFRRRFINKLIEMKDVLETQNDFLLACLSQLRLKAPMPPKNLL